MTFYLFFTDQVTEVDQFGNISVMIALLEGRFDTISLRA